MSDKYAGKIGPADAMDAIDPAFANAYRAASGAILNAVLDFELVTGRVVDEIALERINVSRLCEPEGEFIREASLHFLPKPGEVEW